MKLTETQITEWLRHPVTEQLRQVIDTRYAWLNERRNEIFFPGEPQRTQEEIVTIEGRKAENRDQRMALDSVEDFIAEAEEDGKHIRDLSGGLQSIN